MPTTDKLNELTRLSRATSNFIVAPASFRFSTLHITASVIQKLCDSFDLRLLLADLASLSTSGPPIADFRALLIVLRPGSASSASFFAELRSLALSVGELTQGALPLVATPPLVQLLPSAASHTRTERMQQAAQLSHTCPACSRPPRPIRPSPHTPQPPLQRRFSHAAPYQCSRDEATYSC